MAAVMVPLMGLIMQSQCNEHHNGELGPKSNPIMGPIMGPVMGMVFQESKNAHYALSFGKYIPPWFQKCYFTTYRC